MSLKFICEFMFLTKQIPDSLNLAASSGIIFAGFDLKEKEVDFTVTSSPDTS